MYPPTQCNIKLCNMTGPRSRDLTIGPPYDGVGGRGWHVVQSDFDRTKRAMARTKRAMALTKRAMARSMGQIDQDFVHMVCTLGDCIDTRVRLARIVLARRI